jgi:hypothetical protein
MARLMCIATHHKAGTVWLKRVVKALSRALGLPWLGIWDAGRLGDIPPLGRAFLVNWNSRFPRQLWARDDVAFVHLIRDPRDVLLSGMAYHRTAAPEGERFLHDPRADLGGLTYQQHLNALPDDQARLRFEMGERHAQTVTDMLAWPWGDPRAHELRYETLIQDRDGALFDAALTHLGLTGPERAQGRAAFLANSLFAGLADPSARQGRVAGHIASGRADRWRTEMPRALGRDYAARFGAALKTLGYADSDAWVETLPEHGAAA